MKQVRSAALRVLLCLLCVCMVCLVLPACKKEPAVTVSLTALEEPLTQHTKVQKKLLDDSWKNATRYGTGVKEQSRPDAVTLTWSCTVREDAGLTLKRFLVHISENADLSDAVELRVAKPECSIKNLKIATTYYWRVTAQFEDGVDAPSEIGSFVTDAAAPRNLDVGGVTNVRDLGGWETASGVRVKQGLAFRCAKLNKNYSEDDLITVAGKGYMRETLGIKAEIDLRKTAENDKGKFEAGVEASPLGRSVNYFACPMDYVEDMLGTNEEQIREVFKILADEKNYPLIFHCSIGTDRTGMIAFLLNGLLGVAEEDLYYDYVFSNLGEIGGKRNVSDIERRYVNAIKEMPGATLSDKIRGYLVSIGVTQQELNNIREIFLG